MSTQFLRGHVNTTSASPTAPGRRRRRHSQQFKDEVIGACRQPGVSIAGVALKNGLNANLLRRWVIEAEQDAAQSVEQSDSDALETAGAPQAVASFVPVWLEPNCATPDIRIELNRKGTVVTVTWPSSAAAECAVWLREVLR